MRKEKLSAAIVIFALVGCSFAPPYSVPKSTEVPSSYRESADWKIAEPRDHIDRGAWWLVFEDPSLDELENQSARANQTLKAAFARLQEARAETRIARASLFPSISLNAAVTHARGSRNSPTRVQGFATGGSSAGRTPAEGDSANGNSAAGGSTTGSDFVLEADLSYEVDLWGRIRNEVAAARADEQASAADLASVRLSIQAELAANYFSLRSLDTQQRLLEQTVVDYSRLLGLVQTLFDAGAVPLSDVAQAESQFHTAQTQAADIQLMRAQLEHAIAVLVGANPSLFRLARSPLGDDATPPQIDLGIPSALLQRRPDVARAERQVAAANAQIGVARAAYFPQFLLNASAGFEGAHASDWIGAPSLLWSVGPRITLPLFEGGRLVAQTERAKAAYAEAVAIYRSTVLTAYQDVEDNLAALRRLEDESAAQGQALAAANTALRLSLDRYEAGVVTYIEVATTEAAALQARLSAISIRTRRINGTVLLVKALGGGWR